MKKAIERRHFLNTIGVGVLAGAGVAVPVYEGKLSLVNIASGQGIVDVRVGVGQTTGDA